MKKTSLVRTRFAPSPTGDLHIGSARTALFSWLYARHFGGQFILRIEDTDRERSTQASIDTILRAMEWLELDYDEGPYYQTQHFDRYRAVIDALLAKGHAYKCYCTRERLDLLREKQLNLKEKPRYDGLCRDQAARETNRPYVIRFRNLETGVVRYEDMIRGPIEISNQELDDLIIARSDGTPTYNLTVVVDDWDMQISHVLRGDDHINNTPRQINIFRALDLVPPKYGHVPMILGSDGKRLSKRHGAVSVLQYRDEGILTDALVNYLVRLGFAHGDQEIFSRDEMIQYFDGSAISRSPAAFNQEKLLWLNQHYLKTTSPLLLSEPFCDQLKQIELDLKAGPDVTKIIPLQVERAKTLLEMAEKSRYFFAEFDTYDEKAARKHLKANIVPALTAVCEKLAVLSAWQRDDIHEVIVGVSDQFELKLGKIAQPIRVAVTGNTISPPIDATLELIGRDRVVARLKSAITFAGQQGNVEN